AVPDRCHVWPSRQLGRRRRALFRGGGGLQRRRPPRPGRRQPGPEKGPFLIIASEEGNNEEWPLCRLKVPSSGPGSGAPGAWSVATNGQAPTALGAPGGYVVPGAGNPAHRVEGHGPAVHVPPRPVQSASSQLGSIFVPSTQ